MRAHFRKQTSAILRRRNKQQRHQQICSLLLQYCAMPVNNPTFAAVKGRKELLASSLSLSDYADVCLTAVKPISLSLSHFLPHLSLDKLSREREKGGRNSADNSQDTKEVTKNEALRCVLTVQRSEVSVIVNLQIPTMQFTARALTT